MKCQHYVTLLHQTQWKCLDLVDDRIESTKIDFEYCRVLNPDSYREAANPRKFKIVGC